ncbi:hypothetical protein [Cellulomonas palmilytica]|uniref:hypothetical protein n=1 Tax=Cellulomonas palmilytica TaxID=2608402 RepID=UPI001F1D22F5|nr:hypothetical protein [Cellulomonas palmilytica]UJP39938.1 hypothetical protein F1D97_16955 [Cellulomonas palmilytica]
MTEHESRHPLSGALTRAEHSPEARAYEVPVDLVRTRARRRQRARTAGATGAVALVVAGVALAVPPLLRGDGTTPVADAPPECSLTVEGLRAGDGVLPGSGNGTTIGGDFWKVTTTVDEGSRLRANGAWQGVVRVDVDAPTASLVTAPTGWTLAGTLVLVRDGEVVAVLDGSEDMSLETAGQVAVDAQPVPFPIEAELESSFVSCATAEPVDLDPGAYELVATWVTGWSLGDDATSWVGRATSEAVPVTVPDEAGSGQASAAPPATVPDELLTCGASTEPLADAAREIEQLEPWLDVETSAGPERATVVLTLRNAGSEPVQVLPDSLTAALARDGRIVSEAGTAMFDATTTTLEPGGSLSYDVSLARAAGCDGDLTAGPHEGWAALTVTVDGRPVVVVGEPVGFAIDDV